MKDGELDFRFTQEFAVQQPPMRPVYAVPIDEWNHLKLQIEKIKSRHNIYVTIGATLLGIGATAIGSAFNIPTTELLRNIPVNLVIGSLGVVLIISGGLSILYAIRERSLLRVSKDHVLDLMEFF